MAGTLARDLPDTEKGIFMVVPVLDLLSILDTTYLVLREKEESVFTSQEMSNRASMLVRVGVFLHASQISQLHGPFFKRWQDNPSL